MRVFSRLNLEKKLFLLYLSTKLSWEVEIRYVHFAKALNVLFGGLNFSTSFLSYHSPKNVFFWSFFVIV